MPNVASIVAFAFTIASIHAFGAIIISDFAMIAMDIFVVAGCIMAILFETKRIRINGSNLLIGLALFGVIINAFSNLYFNNQQVMQTIVALGGLYSLGIFLIFQALNIRVSTAISIILMVGFTYVIVHLIQTISFPLALFRVPLLEDRDTIRFRIEGSAYLSVLYFYSLQKYLSTARIKFVVIMAVSLVVFMQQGYRTLIVAYMISSILLARQYSKMRVQNERRWTNYWPLYAFLVVGLIFFFNSIISQQIDSTVQQIGEGKEYVRILEFEYFTGKFIAHPLQLFTGVGYPYYKSDYGLQIQKLNSAGFYWEDIGMVGAWVIMGVAIVVSLIWICIRLFRMANSEDLLWIRYYSLYLIMSSFTTMELYRKGIFGLLGVLCFIVEKKHRKEIM